MVADASPLFIVYKLLPVQAMSLLTASWRDLETNGKSETCNGTDPISTGDAEAGSTTKEEEVACLHSSQHEQKTIETMSLSVQLSVTPITYELGPLMISCSI